MNFLRSFSISIGFLLFLLLLIPNVGQAQEGRTYEVSSAVLNVRGEPSNNSEIIGLLSKGNNVMVFQEKYGWVQTYYGGQVGWIAKHHLIPLTNTHTADRNVSENQSSSNNVTVTATSVNIRSGPSTSYSIIGSTYSGDTYPLVATDGDWHQVSLANGSRGWIASWLTDKTTASEESNQISPADTVENGLTDNDNTAIDSSTGGSLAGYNIVIDPGHGGNDPGAIGLGGVYEKDLVSSTSDIVVKQLRAAGATVIVTRLGDHYISLNQRAHISNSYNTDAFISLHYNAFPIIGVHGVNTYYSSQSDYQLARNVHSSLVSNVNLNNRGIIQENYKVLRSTNAPSILMELGFITNPNDLSIIQTSDYQFKVAQSITNGLINYFN
ncbi:SH3 domain-containing protein [Oceanobacillus sp. 143]|uniref:N-acetylmuramoyl-L-alanine amidase n=1 Tax=Oceanobacillus zhaokaii TaxID=2052660 RepID=A0A345PL66_9BACI|nr:N-acetylmuramoyl-L-alanine amidase [Oceanobacillus zhaokaii]AXI10746.1 N-acetylmuramoyl-L-alanine amidase [Oceanobacillus zhaokaii]QGS69668.1 SH3 domain-containing protein [Oceanobacillus sp. 143]